MKKLHLPFFLCSLILQYPKLNAQTEGAVWSSVKAQVELSEKWTVALEPQLRWTDGELERRIIETGLEVEPIKFLNIEAIHRFTSETTGNGTENYHRVALDLNGKIEVGRFEPNARIRYTNIKDFNADGGANFLRYRVGTEYDIANSKITPEISAEAFQELEGKTLRKVRYTLDTKYKFNKTHSVSLGYKRDQFVSKRKWVNIMDLSYRLRF